jgi:hypothetical protein
MALHRNFIRLQGGRESLPCHSSRELRNRTGNDATRRRGECESVAASHRGKRRSLTKVKDAT